MSIILAPNPGPQTAFSESTVFEVLFGGRKKTGKTAACVHLPLRWVMDPRFRCITFRREVPDLAYLEDVARQTFFAACPTVHHNQQKHLFTFPAPDGSPGAQVRYAFCKNKHDLENYQGHKYQLIIWDELTQWENPDCYYQMMGELFADKDPETGVPWMQPRLRSTTNPGGVGHCVDEGEVLTPDHGWQDIRSLFVGDKVVTILPNGMLSPTVISQVHSSWYEGPMMRVEQPGLYMSCTPNHRVAQVVDGGFELTEFQHLPAHKRVMAVYDTTVRPAHIAESSISRVPFQGRIYCLGIHDTHTFIVRQNGCVWVSGNSWVKSRFEIGRFPDGNQLLFDEETGLYRMFIPGTAADTPQVDHAQLLKQLKTLPSWKYRAYALGSWNIADGAMFEEYNSDEHECDPFEVPPHWDIDCGIDYGYSSYSAVVYVATDPDNCATVVIGELYITKHTGSQLAKRMLDYEQNPPWGKGREIRNRYIDPSTKGTEGTNAHTVYRDMWEAGVRCREANNDRLSGWANIHDRLNTTVTLPSDKTIASFRIMRGRAPVLTEQLPTVQRIEGTDDVDKKRGNDHAPDALRYILMSLRLDNPLDENERFAERSPAPEYVPYEVSPIPQGY